MMGWGIGNIDNGNGGLNFKVVGGTSVPSAPRENTIWVNTNVKIPGWYFSVERPDGIQDGNVWISTGMTSQVEFNTLKKNGVQVYPVSVKQYVGGEWVNVTAKIYQGGEWKELLSPSYIFKEGVGITDGYTVNALYPTGWGFAVDNEKITWGTSTSVGNQIWITPKAELVGRNYLCIELQCVASAGEAYKVAVGVGEDVPTAQDNPGTFSAKIENIFTTERTVCRVPIDEVSVEQYIKVAAFAVAGYVYNIWLE